MHIWIIKEKKTDIHINPLSHTNVSDNVTVASSFCTLSSCYCMYCLLKRSCGYLK
jgi:hypothetical protein